MSVIAVKVGKDKVSLSSDSQLTRGWNKEIQRGVKLWKSSKHLAFGMAGYVEAGAMLRRFSKTRSPERPDADAVSDFMADFYEWATGKGSSKETLTEESEYLVVWKGSAYRVYGYHTESIGTFAAIGSGGDMALTAMHLGKSTKDACRIAAQISLFCHEPIETITMRSADE